MPVQIVREGTSLRGAAWLLAAAVGLVGCSGSGPDLAEGPVIADASDVAWGLLLSEPPESQPGFVEVFTGTGDERVDLEQPLPVVVVQAHHRGTAGFEIQAIRDDDSTEGAVDAVGAYTGEFLTYQGAQETVGFDVRADGQWALLAWSLVTAPDGDELARQYEGAGDAVIGFPIDFDDPVPVADLSAATITHDGDNAFVVRPMFRDVLINEVGSYDETIQLPAEGLFGLEITADGSWTVTFE